MGQIWVRSGSGPGQNLSIWGPKTGQNRHIPLKTGYFGVPEGSKWGHLGSVEVATIVPSLYIPSRARVGRFAMELSLHFYLVFESTICPEHGFGHFQTSKSVRADPIRTTNAPIWHSFWTPKWVRNRVPGRIPDLAVSACSGSRSRVPNMTKMGPCFDRVPNTHSEGILSPLDYVSGEVTTQGSTHSRENRPLWRRVDAYSALPKSATLHFQHIAELDRILARSGLRFGVPNADRWIHLDPGPETQTGARSHIRPIEPRTQKGTKSRHSHHLF